MTDSDDPGPDEGRGRRGQLVDDPSFATVTEVEFNEVFALMRDGPSRKRLAPVTQWRRDFRF